MYRNFGGELRQRAEFHFVQAFAGGDHGVDMFFRIDEQYNGVTIQ